jgi:hypothetical protein
MWHIPFYPNLVLCHCTLPKWCATISKHNLTLNWTLDLAQVKQDKKNKKIRKIEISHTCVYGHFLQIFELDLLELFQWFGNAPKLIRITFDSRENQINKRKREEMEKSHFHSHTLWPTFQIFNQGHLCLCHCL